MKTATLTNDFHGTSARVRIGHLSPRTVRRVRRELCGQDCTCATTALGTRGPQVVAIDAHLDGSADVWIDA